MGFSPHSDAGQRNKSTLLNPFNETGDKALVVVDE
jgi:hypothetical protein